jgi:hypothetical protein
MKRIIYQSESGGVAVIIPTESVELALKDVPAGVPYEIVDAADIPSDRTFRNAWKTNGKHIEVDLPKARAIAHTIRRQKREEEFKPLDDVIVKQIPGTDVKAVEAKRQKIRDKYAKVQVAIDAANSPEEILTALDDQVVLKKDNPGDK